MMRNLYLFCLIVVGSGVGSAAAGQVLINEVCPANLSGVTDEAGEREDWIELYNPGPQAVPLFGYYLTDDKRNLRKWRFPDLAVAPHSRILLWADESPTQGVQHISFKLSRSGEWLGLAGPDGKTLIDSLSYPLLPPEYSFGRAPDGSSLLSAFPTPTPGAPNPTIDQILESPRIYPPGGIFSGPQLIRLSVDEVNVELYFTLDGSVPEPQTNGAATRRYVEPFLLDSSAVLRVRAFRPKCMPSGTASVVFLIRPPYRLPIAVLQVDPADLFDKRHGIYANADSSGKRWERPCRLYFFNEGKLEVEAPAGLRIQGNTGRQMPKKSFRLFFRNRYGADRLHYPLFADAVAESFANLVLRAGYDDDLQKETGTLLRDPLVNELYRRLGLPTSNGRFCALFLNDRFWGIYNLREDIQADFIRSYYGIEEPDVIRLRWGYNNWEVDYGDAREWQSFLDFLRMNDFASEEMFDRLAQELNVEAMTLLQALVHATQYRSWTYGAFFFRDRRTSGPWQVTIWDMDRALTNLSWNGFVYYAQPSGEYWIHFMIGKMLENESFRRRFINRLADLLNTAFLPARSTALLDSLAALVASDIPYEQQRWTPGVDRWAENVEAIRRFLEVRPDTVFQQASRFFRLQPAVVVQLRADEQRGLLRLNSLVVQGNFRGRYFPDIPIDLTAEAKEGFVFIGWSDPTLPKIAALMIRPTDSLRLEALFKPSDGTHSADTLTIATFTLKQNFPNPFNRSTVIPFSLAAAGRTSLKIFDPAGKRVAVLIDNELTAGEHQSVWEADDVPSGVYFVCLQSGSAQQIRKITLLK